MCGLLPSYVWNITSFCFVFYFFFLISPFWDSRTARTRRRIKMCSGSNDADITKEVPFVGFVCMKIHLGVEIHQNVDPPSNVAVTSRSRLMACHTNNARKDISSWLSYSVSRAPGSIGFRTTWATFSQSRHAAVVSTFLPLAVCYDESMTHAYLQREV